MSTPRIAEIFRNTNETQIRVAINLDGTGLTQVTTSPEFDGFPMFSPDGRKLVFASNRNAAVPGETNIFVVEWVEN